MSASWRSIEVSRATAECAELVLVSGPPYVGIGARAQWAVNLAERLKFDPTMGNTLDLVGAEGERRVLLLGVAADAHMNSLRWVACAGHLVEAMKRYRIPALRLPASSELGGAQVLESLLFGMSLRSFELVEPRGRSRSHRAAILAVAAQDLEILASAQRRADAVNRARAWVEQPANVLTPIAWIEEAAAVMTGLGARVRVLEPRQLAELGAGGLLAVGRGSEHGAHLLIIEWQGDGSRDQWDVVFVGKGVTFDAGGLNLKTQPNIAKMKLDMAGGAAVIGALELAIARKSCANVAVLVPIAENVIDALAYRPGDVVTTLSGLTVEIADTDAEGRLVLADAITYGLRHYSPHCVVDVATLTTAVTRVLHEEFAGLYSNDDQLADELLRAGTAMRERLWRLPLDASQDYLVESDIADLCNVGKAGVFGFGAGSPTAGAKFLERFCMGVPWAHLDVTGTVWSGTESPTCGKGATGFGVQMLDHWLACREQHWSMQ